MSEIDRTLCRKAAAECVELARATADPKTKEVLLTRAQEWLKLAYSERDAELERHLDEFNREQMEFRERARAPLQRMPMQQQPVQQQQKAEDGEDEK